MTAFASRRIHQGTHIESLSFVLHDVSHAINISSVVSVNDTIFAVIVGQL